MAKLKLVIDRIEDGCIAVLLDAKGRPRMNLPVDSLPPDLGEGDWLVVTVGKSGVVAIEADRGETETRRKRIREKLNRLRAASGDERGEH